MCYTELTSNIEHSVIDSGCRRNAKTRLDQTVVVPGGFADLVRETPSGEEYQKRLAICLTHLGHIPATTLERWLVAALRIGARLPALQSLPLFQLTHG